MSMDTISLMKKSQLHGINRLTDKKLRLHWGVALLLLFVGAIMSLMITIYRYQTNPTYLSRLEHYHYYTPFPGVLLCPEIDFPEFRMAEFLEEVQIPKGFNKTYFMGVLRQLATFYSPDVLYTVKDLRNIERLMEYNNLKIEQVARRLTSSCEQTIIRCRWRGAIMNCSQLFTLEVMQFGFCCVFNVRSIKRELREKGKPIERPEKKIFTKLIGYKSGLTLAVNQSTVLRNIDLSYKWVMVTGPQRFVDALNVNGSALSPGMEVWFGYYTDGLVVSDTARSLSQDLRRCHMYNEKLEIFPVHRKQYCRLECEIKQMMKKCNCTLPTHPTPEDTYCKSNTITCAKTVSRLTYPSTCKCLSTCDVDMDALMSTSYDLSSAVRPIDDFYDGLDFKKVTILRIYVHTRQMSKRSRQSYFTYYDLFSQMGGIFNVFFGCSVLSLLELLQLLWHGLRKNKQEDTSKHVKVPREKKLKLPRKF